jgi:hypothetical protein
MTKHFDTFALAVKHLQSKGWRNFVQSGKDFWISRDGTCKAVISTIAASKVVAVTVWEM